MKGTQSNDLQFTVVSDEVGSSGNVLLDRGTGGSGEVLDEVGDVVDVGETLESHQIGSETGNVRSGYWKRRVSLESGILVY